MSNETDSNDGKRSIWMRGLFMLLFVVIYSIAEIVVALVAVFQFFCVLITGERNAQVLDLGRSLSVYIYEILRFETFDTERLPFPFEAWPRPGGKEA